MADSWTQVDPQRPQRLECSSGGVTHRVITLVEKDSRLSSHRDDRGGMGEMMAAMLAWMAEQERKMIVRRVKAGLAARSTPASDTGGDSGEGLMKRARVGHEREARANNPRLSLSGTWQTQKASASG